MREYLKKIQPFQSLNMELLSVDLKEAVMSIQLEGNINDKGSMFAGSIYSIMTLCGWSLVQKTFDTQQKNTYNAVIKKADCSYIAPVLSNAVVYAESGSGFSEKKNGNLAMNVTVKLYDNEKKLCAELTGEYIGMKKQHHS